MASWSGTHDACNEKIDALCMDSAKLVLEVEKLKTALKRYASSCEDCDGDWEVDCYCGYARAALKECEK